MFRRLKAGGFRNPQHSAVEIEYDCEIVFVYQRKTQRAAIKRLGTLTVERTDERHYFCRNGNRHETLPPKRAALYVFAMNRDRSVQGASPIMESIRPVCFPSRL